MNKPVPQIDVDEFTARIKNHIPDAVIEVKTINPQYSSWSLQAKSGKLDVEYVWGPLSGFGGRDLARPTTPDDTPFDYADKIFDSLDEALDFLKEKIKIYA